MPAEPTDPFSIAPPHPNDRGRLIMARRIVPGWRCRFCYELLVFSCGSITHPRPGEVDRVLRDGGVVRTGGVICPNCDTARSYETP